MNNKGSSLPLIIFGIVLLIVALVVGYSNVGMTRDQLNEGDSINKVSSDYFIRYGITFVLAIIGVVALSLGLKK